MTPDVCQVMADLTELKFTKSEREVDPIVDSLHHIQRDGMAYVRLEQIKRAMQSRSSIGQGHPDSLSDVPSDRGEGRLRNHGTSKCEEQPDPHLPVIEEDITASMEPDGFLMGTKRQQKVQGKENLTVWQIMENEALRRGIKAAAPPHESYLVAGILVDGQNVHPAKILPCDDSASSADADVKSSKTHIGSRASIRSATRMTPSKVRRNYKRAQKHNPDKKQRMDEPEPEDPDSSDSTVTIGLDETGPPQAGSGSSTGVLSILKAMQAIPEETRGEALARMKDILVQFLPPPNLTVDGDSQGHLAAAVAGAAAAADPSASSPRAPTSVPCVAPSDGTVKVAGEAGAADPSAPILRSPALEPSDAPSDGTVSVAGGAADGPSDGTVLVAKGGLATRTAQPYASLGGDLADASLTLRRPVPPPPPPPQAAVASCRING